MEILRVRLLNEPEGMAQCYAVESIGDFRHATTAFVLDRKLSAPLHLEVERWVGDEWKLMGRETLVPPDFKIDPRKSSDFTPRARRADCPK